MPPERFSLPLYPIKNQDPLTLDPHVWGVSWDGASGYTALQIEDFQLL